MVGNIPDTMRAVRFSRTGGPEVLATEAVPVPEPGPGEVLLHLGAASVNHLDVWLRSGALPVALPHTPGSDGAGVAIALGPGVTGVEIGGRYVIYPGLSCGFCSHCVVGQGQRCDRFSILGTVSAGTYAPFVAIPARNLVPLPDHLDDLHAACLPVAGITAWHLLVTRAGVTAGETVLVHGAGSGLGIFAIQIARLHGARVLATAGSAEKCRLAQDLGAEACFDHTSGNIPEKVLEATGGAGAQVVFDHVGAALFAGNLKALAVGGRLLVCGTTSGGEVKFNLRDLFARQQTMYGARLGGISDLHQVVSHAAAGRIRAVIDQVFPLPRADEAHARMEARTHFGKIVLNARPKR
ncbi:MAG: zinc-binding dehydrogenase [Nitrospirota bacterium]|nr:zinc-binding dehydrogenase [Nitrospirota bacterium]